MKLLNVILVLEQIVSKYQKLLQKYIKKETGTKVNKDKIISNDPRFFVRNKKPEIGKITNDNRILSSTNASSY